MDEKDVRKKMVETQKRYGLPLNVPDEKRLTYLKYKCEECGHVCTSKGLARKTDNETYAYFMCPKCTKAMWRFP